MQLKVKRDQVGNKFRLEIRAELTDEEKAKVASMRLQYDGIYHKVTSMHIKDVTTKTSFAGDVLRAMFIEIRPDAIDVNVTTIQRGHVFEASTPEVLFGLEEKIKEGCKEIQTRLGATALYRGQEQVIDLGSDEPIARANPPLND